MPVIRARRLASWKRPFRAASIRGGHGRLVCGLQSVENRRAGGGRTKVTSAELIHQLLPHFGAALLEQLRADRKLLGHGRVAAPPRAHGREHWHELDGGLGQAVDDALLVARVVGPGQQPGGDQPLEPVGENIGGDSLLRATKQLAVTPAIAEHHVANDDQTPAVTEHLKRQIYWAARSMRILQGRSPTACKIGPDRIPNNWLLLASR